MTVRPEVVTNRGGHTVATALERYWNDLLSTLVDPPDLAIATAYFNPGGFDALSDPLARMKNVRLLIGAEPDVREELARVRTLRRDVLPEDERRVRLQEALREHEAQMEADRDLAAFQPETDAIVSDLVHWLRSEGVEVRRLTGRFLHGKAFIVETGSHGVLAGSSNFTRAGLTTNVELNLGQYQPGVVEQVQSWFDDLWNEAEPYDLAGLYERRFEAFTPREVYLRMLWERYAGELDRDEPPSGLNLTAFQRDGLVRALDYLERHSGVMIADGVGLGKTYLAGELLRRTVEDRRQRALLIAPAALRDGPWKAFRIEHDLMNVQCVSYQELVSDRRLGGEGGAVLWHDPDDYAMVVIDEAHAYRNPDTERARVLRRLLAGTPRKDVVLLTATPVNNSLWDLYHLISYFVSNDAQFLPVGIPSLRAHFAGADAEDPNELSPDALFDVLDAVAVRRTRRFVKRFYPNERIRKHGQEIAISFPQPVVDRVEYDLTGALPEQLHRYAHAFGVDPDDESNSLPSPQEFDYGEQLSLARYVPTAFRLDQDTQTFELQAAGLLRSGLLKRFESSVHAFGRTCSKMAESHGAFLDALDDGWVLTGDALSAWIKSDSDEFDPTLVDGGRRDPAGIYDTAALREAVEADRDLLREFAEQAADVPAEEDPKLEALIDELAAIAHQAEAEATDPDEARDKRKVIVFSYFADTVEWIVGRLAQAVDEDPRLAAYRGRITSTTGSSKNVDDVLMGFAPVSSDAPAGQEDLYDIVVATDVLAEGVNLQQARHIVNYDLPWNPMRMVQRHGRIDRIGSRHARVYLRCFFPVRELDQLLSLEATLQRKITQAAKTIGVEGEIVPGSKADERVFTHTQEQIRGLLNEDATLFEQAGSAGALSGEEFRQELANALRDSETKRRVTQLPWTAGSGREVEGPGGYVFCARVGDDPSPRYRFVPLSEEGHIDLAGMRSETLECLAQAMTPERTDRVLPDAMRSEAYFAWAAARQSIYETWLESTDPRNLQPAVPKPMRDAADLLREHRPEDVSGDAYHRLLETIEAPYDLRTQRMFRKAMGGHNDPRDQVAAIIGVVNELGLEPPEEVQPLPEIEIEDVHLVTWMGLVPEEHRSA